MKNAGLSTAPFWKHLGYDRTFCPVISLAEEKKDAVLD